MSSLPHCSQVAAVPNASSTLAAGVPGIGPGAGAGPLLRFRTLRTSHTVVVRPVVTARPNLSLLVGHLQARDWGS